MTSRARTLSEVLGVFALATFAVAVLWHLRAIPLVGKYLHTMVAALFLLLPHLMLRHRGGVERYGLTTHPRKLGAAVTTIAIGGVLPLFIVGAVLWVPLACRVWPPLSPVACMAPLAPSLRLPVDFAQLVASQVLVVALPEELFFRGYVQGRLEDVLPARRRIFGAPLGAAWLLSSALFAFGHFLVTFDPLMLSRFVPGLVFGWMFARTRSILAGTLFHAACNLVMAVFEASYQH
jgi:uncharacterized protein